MRFNRLDLNLLLALDALLKEQNITRAAARVNVSQSAMSGMLARLREFFEDELLAAVGRNMEPTVLGRQLEAPVRDLILHIHATVGMRVSFGTPPLEQMRRAIIVAAAMIAVGLGL